MISGSELHIAVLTIGATGHINPTLDLAEELLARGHRVTYLAPHVAEKSIAKLGAEHVVYDSTLATKPDVSIPSEEFAVWLPFVLVAEAEHTLPTLSRQVAAISPDVLVYDRTTYLTARILSDLTSTPAVCFFPSFAYSEEFDLIGDLERQTILNPDHEAHLTLRDSLDGLTERWGSRPVQIADLLRAREDHALIAIPRQFQPCSDSMPDGYTFAGPALHHRTRGRLLRSSDATGGIFASLGTAFTDRVEVYQVIADSLSHTNRTGVLVGPEKALARLQSATGTKTTQWADQLQALSHAELFVTHAGMGSVQEAIALGVPMVCIPSSTEQRAVAARVAHLGLGLMIGPTPSESELTAAIDQALADRELRQRCRLWSEQVRLRKAGSIGADALQEVTARS